MVGVTTSGSTSLTGLRRGGPVRVLGDDVSWTDFAACCHQMWAREIEGNTEKERYVICNGQHCNLWWRQRWLLVGRFRLETNISYLLPHVRSRKFDSPAILVSRAFFVVPTVVHHLSILVPYFCSCTFGSVAPHLPAEDRQFPLQQDPC